MIAVFTSPTLIFLLSAAVNAALASMDRSTMLSLATALDADNKKGCPLNGNNVSAIQSEPATAQSEAGQQSNPLVAIFRSILDALSSWPAPSPLSATRALVYIAAVAWS